MIQCNREYLESEKNISTLVEKSQKILRKRQRLYSRYTRKTDNSDIKVPLEYYIANIASGFFGGKAPKYTIKQETNNKKKKLIKKLFKKLVGQNADSESFKLLIDYIRDYNDDGSFFYDLVKDYLITEACYGIIYENKDNEIVYAQVPSVQTVAIYDYSTPIQKIGLLRQWTEIDKDGFNANKVELITETEKRYYINSKKQPKEYKEIIDEKDDVKWSMLPAIAIENPDELGIFEPVLSLIDAYETVIENNKNTFQYNDDAKLKVTGYMPNEPLLIPDEKEPTKLVENPKRKQEDAAFLNAKVFYTPDNTGDIGWIIKSINDTASENHKKTLVELILMTTCVPNITDVGFTNADNSSALEKKFFPLEQVLIQADKQFKKELLYMWELIIDRINREKKTNFDFREIQIELQRNMPQDKEDLVAMALQLRDLLSDETVISMLPFDLDVESEIAKKQGEVDDNMKHNQETIKKFNNQNETDENEKEEVDE